MKVQEKTNKSVYELLHKHFSKDTMVECQKSSSEYSVMIEAFKAKATSEKNGPVLVAKELSKEADRPPRKLELLQSAAEKCTACEEEVDPTTEVAESEDQSEAESAVSLSMSKLIDRLDKAIAANTITTTAFAESRQITLLNIDRIVETTRSESHQVVVKTANESLISYFQGLFCRLYENSELINDFLDAGFSQFEIQDILNESRQIVLEFITLRLTEHLKATPYTSGDYSNSTYKALSKTYTELFQHLKIHQPSGFSEALTKDFWKTRVINFVRSNESQLKTGSKFLLGAGGIAAFTVAAASAIPAAVSFGGAATLAVTAATPGGRAALQRGAQNIASGVVSASQKASRFAHDKMSKAREKDHRKQQELKNTGDALASSLTSKPVEGCKLSELCARSEYESKQVFNQTAQFITEPFFQLVCTTLEEIFRKEIIRIHTLHTSDPWQFPDTPGGKLFHARQRLCEFEQAESELQTELQGEMHHLRI